MKKLLLSMSLAVSFGAISQTTLFQDNLEAGSGNWTFNGTGDNAWIVNNIYYGGGWVTDTPDQPGTITNAPNSTYMHIMSGAGCSMLGACNASFDTGSSSNQNAEMSGVSTVGMSNVNVEFWYICAGFTGTSYGSLQYSIDNGVSWTTQSTYSNISTWTLASQTNPIWANQANLRIRFKWQNGGAGNDPAFAVDDILITASVGANGISTTNDVTPTSWCAGTLISGTVNFVSTGTFNPGNVYSAQLSDASGSFASPTVVGTLGSSANGSLSILTAIPGSTPVGNGYRIRVVASDPATTGTDNGSDLVINALPTVTLGTFADVCLNHSASTLTGGSPAGGTYSGTGVSAGMFDPAVAGVGSHTITYTYADGNGCMNMDSEPIVVDGCASIEELEGLAVSVYPNPTDATFIISTEGNVTDVQLVDMSGRKVKSFMANSAVYDIQDVNSGVYLLQINNNSVIQTIRLVIK